MAYALFPLAVGGPFALIAFRFNEVSVGRAQYIAGTLLLIALAFVGLPESFLWLGLSAFGVLSALRVNALGASTTLRFVLTFLPVLLVPAALPFALLSKRQTPGILLAAADGDVAKVLRHLESGAPIDTLDYRGATPLMLAARNGRSDVVNFLIDRGADPTLTLPSGLSAADIAERHGYRAIAVRLRQASLTPFRVATHRSET